MREASTSTRRGKAEYSPVVIVVGVVVGVGGRFAKVDTEAEQQLGGSLGIQSIPTIMAFRDGVLLFSQPGALPAASLEQLITSIREVDMVEVHKQIAEQENSTDNT